MAGNPFDLFDTQAANPFDKFDANARPLTPEEANGPWQAFLSGLQSSSTGLLVRGKLPDVQIDPQHAKWYEKVSEFGGQLIGDAPESVAGFIGGGIAGAAAGGPIGAALGAGAGGLAVPTALRESLVQAYSKGAVVSSGDFLNRAEIVMKETAKSAVLGAATAGGGLLAAKGIDAVAGEAISPGIARTVGQVASYPTVNAAMQGRLPEPQDFADAALMIGGMHMAFGGAEMVSRITPKVLNIYARTGIEPGQVAEDARVNPEIADQLKSDSTDMPTAYEPIAAQQAAHDIVPDPKTDPDHAMDLYSMLKEPYGTIPAEKLPNYENFRYVDGPTDMQAVSARASEVFADQIQAARGTESWDETKDKAIEFLAKRATANGQTFTMPTSDDALVDLASRGMAAESMQQAAARALADASAKVINEGATPENTQAQIAAIEMVRAWTAMDQGNGAEIARALNARKAATQMRAISQGVLEGVGRYGDDPARLAQFIADLKDPQKIAKFAGQVEPATAMDKLLQYYRFSLLTGATVFQVKGIGDTMATMERIANAALRVPAAVVGSGEVGERAAEFSAMMGSLFQGVKDGMKSFSETWKAWEPRQVYDSALANKITGFPGRLIESETSIFRTINERMEMSRQATNIAMKDGFRPGTDDFAQRVTTLLQNPTDKMTEAAEAAGKEATFTNKTSGLGKLLQDISNGKYGKWGGLILPFAKVPVNIAAWSIKDTPALGMLMEGNREDWAAGGMRRDGVLARQFIGGTVAALTASAVAHGTLTGGGQSLSPNQRNARRAAGVQDYSVKIGDAWYSYERFQPLGAIAMLAADLMEMREQADENSRADIGSLTAAIMGHAIISQPYFEGIHSFMDALTSPAKGARKFDSLVGAWIPSALAQTASSMDSDQRRVDGLMDTVKQRIPVWRETLLPKIDPLTGEPVPNSRGLGLVATSQQSSDPVLSEAVRLGVGAPGAPTSIKLPSGPDRTLGEVKLTPDQQNLFTSAAGKLSHEILSRFVGTDAWDNLPDVYQRKLYDRALAEGRKVGRVEALTPEQRTAEAQRIYADLQAELAK